MRRAMSLHDQVDCFGVASGIQFLQEVVCGNDYLLRFDRKQAAIGPVGVRAIVNALGAAQHNRSGGIRAITLRASWSKERDDRYSQGRSQVHWPSVSSHEQAGAARERNQLTYRAAHGTRDGSAGVAHLSRQLLFVRTEVHHHGYAMLGQRSSNLAVG